jgi:hypothetical protein
MVNRPAGGHRSKKWERAPYDWYREGPAPVEQLFHGVDFGDDLIWDPCCGAGNILDVAARYGHPVFGSDLINRNPKHKFELRSALSITALPDWVRFFWMRGRAVSIVSNTPYSYEPTIAERIIAHLLHHLSGHVRRFAFIVPIAFLAGQERWRDNRFAGRWRPSHTAIYRERHTMPPGHLIDQMATPYDGGMADYAVLIFTSPHRWRSETIWLSPGRFPERPRRAIAQGE